MRLLCHVLAAVVGAVVAVAAVTVHRSVVLHLPAGLLLGLLATFVAIWALRQLLARLATSFGAGWVVAFGFVVVGKPEGDYAVAGDLRGYALFAAAFAVIVVGVASLSPRHSSSGTGAA